MFNEQGVSIDDVHIEIILRQMARLGKVMDSGDTDYLVGSLVNRFLADAKNGLVAEDGKNKALVVPRLLGIKTSSLNTESFLSAVSFQEQVRVLTSNAILGKTDFLRGMKENVIIGKLIPAGTGMKRYRNIKLDSDVNEEEEFSFDDLEDFTMDEEEEMIPTVTVPDGTDLSAVSGTDEDSSEE